MFKKEYVLIPHSLPLLQPLPPSRPSVPPPLALSPPTTRHATQKQKLTRRSLSPGPKTKVKSSVQRALRQSLTTTYPLLTPHIDAILPKKSDLASAKLPDRVALYTLDSHPLFFQHDKGPPLPHLRLVHRYPHAFPSVRIDRGAVRFVLSGATLMAPGLTSAGGRLPESREASDEVVDGRWGRELEAGEPVVIMAEGKEEACAVGVLSVGTKELKEKKKGPAMDDAHFLGDGLWKMHMD